MKTGLLLVISGPSGVGKGTVLAEMTAESTHFHYSVSATTRAPREGEVEGVSYFFLSKEAFLEKIEKHEMLEYAIYNGNYYGTPREAVEKQLAEGKDVILEIEVQGALSIQSANIPAVFIFILPPSLEELEKRLRGRKTNSEEDIANRLSIASGEIQATTYYDYIVVNDEISLAKKRMLSIVDAQHCSKKQMEQYIQNNF